MMSLQKTKYIFESVLMLALSIRKIILLIDRTDYISAAFDFQIYLDKGPRMDHSLAKKGN